MGGGRLEAPAYLPATAPFARCSVICVMHSRPLSHLPVLPPGTGPMPNQYVLAYYPWITQGIDAGVVRAAVSSFAAAVEARLSASMGAGTSVVVSMAADIPPLVEQVVTRERTIALLNPLGYVFARRRNASVEVVAVALRPDATGAAQPTYRAQIYTAKRTGLRSLADVKGRSIGFGVPFSTSNFLVPAALLKAQHRLYAASSLSFLGGHDVVAKAVYEGRVDVGAGHDGVIVNLARTYGYGDAEERLLRLAWTDPIPSDPVVVNIPDSVERRTVAEAIVAAGQDQTVIREAIAVFWGGSLGLSTTTADAYNGLEATLGALALEQADLLG